MQSEIQILRIHFLRLYFFRLTTKLEGQYRGFSYTLRHHVCTAPITTTAVQGAFVPKDKPARTHHHHAEAIVYIRVQTWGCMFCGFGQLYNDVCPLL